MLFNPDQLVKNLIRSLMKLCRINFEMICKRDKIIQITVTNYNFFLFYIHLVYLFYIRLKRYSLILYVKYICAIRQYNSRDTPIQVSSTWQLIKNQFTGLRVMPVTHRNQSICMQMYSRYSEWTLAPFVFWNILVPANARSCANQLAEINQFISLRSDF